MEPEETFEQAALRETSEELGLTSPSLTFLWENTTEFIYIDRPVHQQERFFRVEGDLSSLLVNVEEIHRQEGILESKWWTVGEIEAASEPVFPDGLAQRIKNYQPSLI